MWARTSTHALTQDKTHIVSLFEVSLSWGVLPSIGTRDGESLHRHHSFVFDSVLWSLLSKSCQNRWQCLRLPLTLALNLLTSIKSKRLPSMDRKSTFSKYWWQLMWRNNWVLWSSMPYFLDRYLCQRIWQKWFRRLTSPQWVMTKIWRPVQTTSLVPKLKSWPHFNHRFGHWIQLEISWSICQILCIRTYYHWNIFFRRQALTEVTVLYDVLNIYKDKRYLVLDPVQQEIDEIKPITALIAKKKVYYLSWVWFFWSVCVQALSNVAAIIANGVDRMRTSATEANRNRSTDFHSELFTMRQNWRLRKKENAILGDLSYMSGEYGRKVSLASKKFNTCSISIKAGSRFHHTGTFEVTKNEDFNNSGDRVSALKVKVPAALEGGSFFLVKIKKG